MKENKLLTLSQEFAVEIIKISQLLKDKKEYSFADQIKRSGTSISANISEGNNPQSRLDMISKFEKLLAESVRYAFDHPLLSRDFVKEHAQELEDEVIDKHISLFVNDYTISLGEEGRKAVEKLVGNIKK